VLVYAPGQVYPMHKLKTRVEACTLSNGTIQGDGYVFVPSCTNGDFYLLKPDAGRKRTRLTFRPGTPARR